MGMSTEKPAREHIENINYCSICSTSFDANLEGDKGMIGLVPFAFCGTCVPGLKDWAQLRYNLVEYWPENG